MNRFYAVYLVFTSRRVIASAACVVLMFSAINAGCSSSSSHTRSPYERDANVARDPAEAQRLTLEAADLMNTKPGEAEELLIRALIADLYHGPAHNNLGVIYLQQDKLYEAAGEFEWARRLMPGHPDPRMNLALTLERAGRVEDALAEYATALEVYPGHIPTMQALARLRLRETRGGVSPLDSTSGSMSSARGSSLDTASIGDATPSTRELLREIALRGETQRWRDWAQLQLAQHDW